MQRRDRKQRSWHLYISTAFVYTENVKNPIAAISFENGIVVFNEAGKAQFLPYSPRVEIPQAVRDLLRPQHGRDPYSDQDATQGPQGIC